MNVFIDQMVDFKNRFFRLGGTMALFLNLLGDDELMEHMIKSAEEKANANPFEQTVDEQIAALRAQNEAGSWGITEDVFVRLAQTAPAWPKGKDAYRSLRIRFGEGDEGVALTFERHAEAMKRVHDPKFWRWELLHSGTVPYQGKSVERLRLLNGNQSHKAVVEWVIISDLSANRTRKDITSVRSVQSLADEGLVLAWMFPKRAQAIDYDKWCAWYCGGYESNVPEHGEEWQRVVVVGRDTVSGRVHLHASWRSGDNSGYSVPPLG